jgi:hypothetical protein
MNPGAGTASRKENRRLGNRTFQTGSGKTPCELGACEGMESKC